MPDPNLLNDRTMDCIRSSTAPRGAGREVRGKDTGENLRDVLLERLFEKGRKTYDYDFIQSWKKIDPSGRARGTNRSFKTPGAGRPARFGFFTRDGICDCIGAPADGSAAGGQPLGTANGLLCRTGV
jgi:hypothetical protein